ncbi:hypothetical protein B0H67DRAFT_243611 [Lasiosphaeris hirsuta]|uniref:Uncharacterized protein n=1 Tax=Lasiosphaeris hirsuta TaxID=260670 RepID=A0AA40AGT4_9PEZI|nr:hypothetical protein B0H67DRAFT_243611 [Lasiosphaeris hirsuta]
MWTLAILAGRYILPNFPFPPHILNGVSICFLLLNQRPAIFSVGTRLYFAMNDISSLGGCLGGGRRKLHSMNIGSVSCEHMAHWQAYINRLIEGERIWGRPCSLCLIDIIMWHRCKPSLLDVELLQTAPEMMIQATIKNCVHAVAEGMRLLSNNTHVPLQSSEPPGRACLKNHQGCMITSNARQPDNISFPFEPTPPDPQQSPIARHHDNSSVSPTGDGLSTSAHLLTQFESRFPSLEHLDRLLPATNNQTAPRRSTPNTASCYPPPSRANVPSRSTTISPSATRPSLASQRGGEDSSSSSSRSRGQQQRPPFLSSPTSASQSSQPTPHLARNTADFPFRFNPRPLISPETTPRPPSWNHATVSDADEGACPPTPQTHVPPGNSNSRHHRTNTSPIRTAVSPTPSRSRRDTASNRAPRRPAPLSFNVQVSQDATPGVAASRTSDTAADPPVELQVYLGRPSRQGARGDEHRARTAHDDDSRRPRHRRASTVAGHDGRRGPCDQDSTTSNESVSCLSSSALGLQSGRKRGSEKVARRPSRKDGRRAKGYDRRGGSNKRRENAKELCEVRGKGGERGARRSSGCGCNHRERTGSMSTSGSIFRALVCWG